MALTLIGASGGASEEGSSVAVFGRVPRDVLVIVHSPPRLLLLFTMLTSRAQISLAVFASSNYLLPLTLLQLFYLSTLRPTTLRPPTLRPPHPPLYQYHTVASRDVIRFDQCLRGSGGQPQGIGTEPSDYLHTVSRLKLHSSDWCQC